MRLATFTLATTLAFAAPGIAEEQILAFRLVTRDIQRTTLPAPSAPGVNLTLAEIAGTAVFEDGRIANKHYVVTSEGGKAGGTYIGYSVYSFENGDTLNLRFTGGWGADGSGGDYEVLSGTGGFEGATGAGRFDRVPAQWTGAVLWNGRLVLDVPKR